MKGREVVASGWRAEQVLSHVGPVQIDPIDPIDPRLIDVSL
jgi:hypothetical protein